MEHVARDGEFKIVKECSLPLTGERVVHRIITDLAVLDVTDQGLRLVECAPGAQLADVGYIAAGSITRRHTRCGTPSCRCHADPPQMHGPYWQWTAKIDGKTVTRRLSQSEAELYQEWIANDRQLRAIITQMRQVAAKATELTMNEAKNKSAKV